MNMNTPFERSDMISRPYAFHWLYSNIFRLCNTKMKTFSVSSMSIVWRDSAPHELQYISTLSYYMDHYFLSHRMIFLAHTDFLEKRKYVYSKYDKNFHFLIHNHQYLLRNFQGIVNCIRN